MIFVLIVLMVSAATVAAGPGQTRVRSINIVEEGCPSSNWFPPILLCEDVVEEDETMAQVAHLTAEDVMLLIILVGTLRG